MDKERTGMLLLSKEDIKSVITMKDMIEADKQAFKMVVDGTVDTPLRTVINGKYDGAFLFMPAGADHADRRKDGICDRDAGWNLCDTASYGGFFRCSIRSAWKKGM